MSLIKGKNGIQKFIVGYPTVSDKYDVAPATLEGTTAVKNGDVVMFGSASGLYKKAASLSAATEIAGIVLATNVKVPSTYPAETGSVPTNVGEQFNLIVKGYVAVEATGTITAGTPVYVTSAGAITATAASNIATTWKFTGLTEVLRVEGSGEAAVTYYAAEIVL